MSDTIILNRICTGDYLDEGANLGHEVVNLFKADNGKYYVYLMPDGTYIESREKDKVRVIYLTKKIKDDCVEVLAVATGIEPIIYFGNGKGFKHIGLRELKEISTELSDVENLSRLKKKLEKRNESDLYEWLDTKKFMDI